MKSLYFLFILLVLALGMGGCSSKQKSTNNEQSNIEILKVQDDKSSKAIQTTQPTEKQESSEKATKDSAAKDISYEEYFNHRFGFSIEYPSTFITKMLPANGDGIILESLDGRAELTVFGSNNVFDSTSETCFDDFIKEHEDISFKVQKDNWFVASWIEGDKIWYTKEVVGNGSINTFLFKYPLTQKEYYDQVVKRLLESFKAPDISQIHGMVLDEEIYDYAKVLDLFVSRFLIESLDKNNILYALKSNPSEFLYTVYVDRFDAEKDMYEIRLSRNTDTAHNYFYFNPDTRKFYNDGTEKEEIASDDSIFFWSPF